jgi:hypothetical protein
LDTRVRLPRALRGATASIGPFPVNLRPRCFEADLEPEPDHDAVYLASRREVEGWARARGYCVTYPGGQDGQLRTNVLIEIAAEQTAKPLD